MLTRPVTVGLCLATGVALELGVHAMSGRKEAWDSTEFWTIGMPLALFAAFAIGRMSAGSDWIWTLAVAPAQVLTLMLRSEEMGNLWPLTLMISTILSVPFVMGALVGSRFRKKREKHSAF